MLYKNAASCAIPGAAPGVAELASTLLRQGSCESYSQTLVSWHGVALQPVDLGLGIFHGIPLAMSFPAQHRVLPYYIATTPVTGVKTECLLSV
jgi:hypothetical protein